MYIPQWTRQLPLLRARACTRYMYIMTLYITVTTAFQFENCAAGNEWSENLLIMTCTESVSFRFRAKRIFLFFLFFSIRKTIKNSIWSYIIFDDHRNVRKTGTWKFCWLCSRSRWYIYVLLRWRLTLIFFKKSKNEITFYFIKCTSKIVGTRIWPCFVRKRSF